jgi:hypothetical protein
VPLRQRAPHLPDPVVELVERMLSRDRAKRPPDVSSVLSVLADYTNETFVLVAWPPAAPSRQDRTAAIEPQASVDADAARASTLDGTPKPYRSGAEARSRSTAAARSRGLMWTVLAALAASTIGVGALASWRARTSNAPHGSPANAGGAQVTLTPVAVTASRPTVLVEPPPASGTSQGTVVTPDAGVAMRRRGTHPRPASSSVQASLASTSSPFASPAAPSVSGAAPPVDPGSYQ